MGCCRIHPCLCLFPTPLPLRSCYSVAQSCQTLCNPMDHSTPGFPVLHYLLELAQTHVHWVSDDIQPSHLYHLLIPLPSIFPSIRGFSNKLVLDIKWPKYWSFRTELKGPDIKFKEMMLKLFFIFSLWETQCWDFLLQCKWISNPASCSHRAHSKSWWLSNLWNVHVALDSHVASLVSQLVSSVAQSCPTLCDPVDRSTPGLPVHHQLPEFT